MFELDPRLAADTYEVGDLPLCRVLLMNESRYPWLIAVPRRPALTELTALPADEYTTLWQEMRQLSLALPALAPFDKLNVGALGNVVAQLHVHIVGRRRDDPAWPAPVWGHGPIQPYPGSTAQDAVRTLRKRLAMET